jgi:hypothetical protein
MEKTGKESTRFSERETEKREMINREEKESGK